MALDYGDRTMTREGYLVASDPLAIQEIFGSAAAAPYLPTSFEPSGVDDTEALEALLVENATVTLLQGKTYRVADLAVPANRTIVGNGATLKLKALESGDTSPIIRVTGDHVRLRGLILDGNKAVQPADGFADAYLSGSTGRSVRCAVLNDGNDDLEISSCIIKQTFGGGVVVRDASQIRVNGNAFFDLNFEAFWASKSAGGCSGLQFNSNYLENIGSGHISVNGNGVILSKVERASVCGNVAFNLERNFCKVEGDSKGITINGNVIDTITVDNFAAIQLQALSAPIAEVAITGNRARNVGAGVQLNGSGTSSGVFADITITANIIKTTTGTSQGDGIDCIGGGSGLVIADNVLRGVQRYGVRVRSTVAAWAGVQVRSNTLEGGNAASSSNIGIYIWPDTGGEITDLHVVDNQILGGFVSAAGVGWITLWTPSGGSALRRGRIVGNVVKAASGARALEQAGTSTTVDNVTVDGNILDGLALVQNTGVIWRDTNRVTGALAVPLYGTATWNPGSVDHNTPASTTVTCSGAAVGDRVEVAFSLALSGLRLHGEVTAADTVTCYLTQPDDDATGVDLASGTVRAWVKKGLA